MTFGRWHALGDIAAKLPAAPGVLQLRVANGLIDYPRGKSAMIHYLASDDVRAAAIGLAAEYHERPWLCRYSVEMSPSERADVHAALTPLLKRFEVRFGAVPSFPA